MLSLRASAHAGVAIPRLEGKCIDNSPAEWENVAFFGGNRHLAPFNREIATTSLRTGLAMTGNLEPALQTPIYLPIPLPCFSMLPIPVRPCYNILILYKGEKTNASD